MTLRCIALCLVLVQGATLAQSAAACEPAAPTSSRIVSPASQSAIDAAIELVQSAGANANLRSIRETVLRVRFPGADVDLTLRKMLQAFCEVVQVQAGLSESQKLALTQSAEADLLQRVQGPTVVARTSSRIRRAGWPDGGGVIRVASLSNEAWVGQVLAQSEAQAQAYGPTADDFLREAPAYVNDSNKYFVIVGSATSEKTAVELMNRLHKKAPQYDFVVYLPYGANPSYAVMMAAWVSKEVAQQALRAAKKEVEPSAYLWVCRSGGESC